MSKSLVEKAIDFKGKKYVLVADRVLYFNETYPKGCITTELVSATDSNDVTMKAEVYPDGISGRMFTGYSQATWGEGYINQTSALENAETSAVGRALAFMGIGVIESIASIDEIKKTSYPTKKVEPQLSTTEAFEKAQLAIAESADLDALAIVDTNIRKSKILNETQKNMLLTKSREKAISFDPTE